MDFVVTTEVPWSMFSL